MLTTSLGASLYSQHNLALQNGKCHIPVESLEFTSVGFHNVLLLFGSVSPAVRERRLRGGVAALRKQTTPFIGLVFFNCSPAGDPLCCSASVSGDKHVLVRIQCLWAQEARAGPTVVPPRPEVDLSRDYRWAPPPARAPRPHSGREPFEEAESWLICSRCWGRRRPAAMGYFGISVARRRPFKHNNRDESSEKRFNLYI